MSSPGAESLYLIADQMIAFDRTGDAPASDGPVGILIRDGRIAAVGPAADLRPAQGTRVLELAGTVTPGLTDAHIHLTEWALARREIELAGTTSPEQAASRVSEAAGAGGGWIRGRGWNPHDWNGRTPHRALLDHHLPDRPVALQSHDMHALWVNGAALERAGITAGTADPAGGRIVRDEAGAPTGLLLENAAELVTRALPALERAATVAAVLDAQAELHAHGITGVHAFPSIHIAEPEPLATVEAVRDSGRLRLRVLQHLPLRMLDDAIRIGLRSGFGGAWIRIGAVKMFLDGALGSRTAWMREPYEGESQYRGLQVLEPGEFRYHVRRAAAAGLATTVHAIGDAAVALAFDTLADPATAVAALPHRVEHVQCCPPERAAEPGAAGITCSMQPAHLITDWPIADRHWGRARARATYAFRPLLDGGAILAFGSDAPVEPVDPRLGLFAAVARTGTDGRPDGGWFAEHRLTPTEALYGYTRGPARAAGRADGGRIAVGAPADLAVWDRDPRTCSAAQLLELRCTATLVGGEVVHS